MSYLHINTVKPAARRRKRLTSVWPRPCCDRDAQSLECYTRESSAYILYLASHLTHKCVVCRSAEDNFIPGLEAGALRGVRALRSLRLARNLLRDVPTHALAPLHHLQTLYVRTTETRSYTNREANVEPIV